MGIMSVLFTEPMCAARAEVEQELALQKTLFPGRTKEMYAYVMHGGMRFRPLLVYLGSFLVGGACKNLALLAAALEMLHKASLIHDDLIDGDPMRRGRPSFHCRFGEREAVVMGDLLVAASLKTIRPLQDRCGTAVFLQIHAQLVDVVFLLSRGVLREIEAEGCFDDRAEIEGIMYEKTAVFLETCLRCGALLGNSAVKEGELDALVRLGKNLGLIFQILNDFNNVRCVDKTGRGSAGLDLPQAKATLLSHTLWERSTYLPAGIDETAKMRGIFNLPDEKELFALAGTFIRPLLGHCGAALAALPDSPWKDELLQLDECVMELWSWEKMLSPPGAATAAVGRGG